MFNYLGNNSYGLPGIAGNFGYPGSGAMSGISPLGMGMNPMAAYAGSSSLCDSMNYGFGGDTGLDAPIFNSYGMGAGYGACSPMMYGGCMPYNSTTQQMLNSMTPEQYVQMTNGLQKLQMQGQADIAQTGLQQNMALNRQYNQANIQQAIEMNRNYQQANASIAEPQLIFQEKAKVLHDEIVNKHNFQPEFNKFVEEVCKLQPNLSPEGKRALTAQLYGQATGSDLQEDIVNYSPSSTRKGFTDTFLGGILSDGEQSVDKNMSSVYGIEEPPTSKTKEGLGKVLGIVADIAVGIGAILSLKGVLKLASKI